MEAGEKCVRTYLQHGMQFSIFPRTAKEHLWVLPSGTESKPYAIVSDADLAYLTTEPVFKSAMEQNLIKILPAIPAQFQEVSDTLVKVRVENGELKEQIAGHSAIVASKDAKIEELSKIISENLSSQGSALSPEKIIELQDRMKTLKP